jgi:hypothetical protein
MRRRSDFDPSEVRVADLPSSAGIERGQPLLRSLRLSVAVVLAGGVVAAFTTPTASGNTVLKQGLGLAVPADADDAGPGGPAGPGAGAGVTGPGATAAASVGAPAPTGPAATTAAPTAAKAKATGTTAAPKGTAAPAAGAPAAKAAAPKLQPAAGTYPLSISGSSSVDGKPSTVPSSGSLVIEQRGGDQQHRTVGVPGGLVLVQRASDAGVDLVSFSLSAGANTLTFRPPSPLAFVRTQPGASWSWSVRSTDGKVSLNQTASVSGGGSVNVGGTSVPAVTIDRTFTVSGALQGTVRLSTTVSTVDRLPLRTHQAINVKATVLGLLSTTVVSDATATLTSTTPR